MKIRTDSQQQKAWRIFLEEHNMSAYRLAKEAGLPYTTIQNGMKRDIGKMQIETVTAIVNAFGMTIDEFVNLIRYKDEK